jgi:nucleoside-diphosphate-sugar epimerase
MTPAYLPKRFALTGATGALGFAFLRDIFTRLPEVRATLLVRTASASFKDAPFQAWLNENVDRIKLIDGDVRKLNNTQRDALVRTDGGLWHFAAMTDLTSNDEEISKEIHDVNVEGTRHLVEACLQSGHRHPLFHVSTAYVLGNRTGTIRETERAQGQEFRNPYEASKSAAEEIVQTAFAKGVPGAIFRPSVVVDDLGDTGGFKIVDACAFAVALAVKQGEPFVFRLPPTAGINLVHSDWIVAAMLDLARMPSGPGRTYHLTAPKPTFFRDIGGILTRLVPGLKMSFEPELKRSELPTASRLFDKAASDLRPYFEADVNFDRTHAGRDLSPKLKQTAIDLKPFVEVRLRAELARIDERQAKRAGVVAEKEAP